MSPRRALTVRVRRDGDDLAWCYPIAVRRGETVRAAIRRALRAASGWPTATLERGFSTFLISDTWQPAYRFAHAQPHQGAFAGDVDVPAGFPIAWL